MQVIEDTPTYYRVQMPSGEVMTIAKTPGTQAMVQAQTLGGAGRPADYVTAPDLQAPVPDALDAATSTPVPMMNTRPLPPVVGGGGASTLSTVQAPKPTIGGLLGLNPLETIDATMSAAADLSRPVRKVVEKGVDLAKDVAATPLGERPNFGASSAERAAAPEAEAAPREGPGDGFYTNLAQALDPLVVSEPGTGAPAGPAPSGVGLAEAQGATAADANYYAQEIAKVHAGSQGAPPPTGKPVDPGKFYENVGTMFGASNPRSARIIGGIATGLVQAMGAFGAALTHGQNQAATILQQAIADNIGAQQDANTLTRQQWVDQTLYSNALAGKKIDELAALAQGQAGIDKAREAAEQMKLNLALQTWKGLAQKGAISADTANKLSDVEYVRGAARDLASLLGTFPSGWWANFDDKRLPGDDQNVKAAAAAMAILNNRIENMLKTRGKLAGESGDSEATRGLEALKITLQDPQKTIKTKLQAIANMARQQQAVVRAVGAGVDPSGATLPTPGARPN